MAEEPVTKWWAVGAKEESTARKYISFLHKHSMFGGHVGLPENIRNKDANRSLDSTRGIYDMVEVYSISGTSCPTGMVVNFELNNTVNPLGTTYVYPCNDISKPMGYMITRAEPNVWGVCVVSGVIEVPLIYLRGTSASEIERKDYVEYDLEEKAFKFSDFGYPVYNIYQDVDGDWIAIILFGNIVAEGGKYDGPFAVSIDHYDAEVPDKMWLNCEGGEVILNHIFGKFCSGFTYTLPDETLGQDDDLLGNIALSTGESLWLKVTHVENPSGYDDLTFDFLPNTGSSTPPLELSGVSYFKIAENNSDGDLVQVQYGNIEFERFKEGVNIKIEKNPMNPSIEISSPYTGPFTVVLDSIGTNPTTETRDGTAVEISGMTGFYHIEDSHVVGGFNWGVPGSTGEDADYPVPVGRIVTGSTYTNVFNYFGGAFDIVGNTEAYVYLYESGGNYNHTIVLSGNPDILDYEGPTIEQNEVTYFSGKFFTRLAKITLTGDETGKVEQIQFGDIVQPKETSGGGAIQSLSCDVSGSTDASISLSEGGGGVTFRATSSKLSFAEDAEDEGVIDVSVSEWKYDGPFKATITGSTAHEGEGTTYDVEIIDGCARNSQNTHYAGYIIDGDDRIGVNDDVVSCTDGQYIYLVGSTGSYEYLASDSTYATNNAAFSEYDFVTLIAYLTSDSDGEKAVQVQFGDIVAPPSDLIASVSGSTAATIGLKGSTSSIKLKSSNSNLTFSSGSSNTINLTVTGMGGSFGYPAYGLLSTNDQGVTLPDVQGISFLLPVKAGHNIRYYTDASGGVVVGRYAPNDGSSGGSEFYISQTNQETGADGWVRISVFDDGSSPGACLKFIDNGSQYPLYKFGSGTGGGGNINAPNWGWSGSSGGETARIEHSDNSTKYAVAPNFYPYTSGAYITPSSGWLYAFANVRSGEAHLNVNGALFKVAYSESSSYVGSGICIPVNANTSVSWNIGASAGNYLVGCVFYSAGSGGGGGSGT